MLQELINAVRGIGTTTIVSCPKVPGKIPGIGAGAEGALDALGVGFWLPVPKRGVIVSAMYYDMDFEGTQVNLHIFRDRVTAIADNAAWTLSDADAPSLITTLSFVSYITHAATCYTFDLTNIGKAYACPGGKFWIQASCIAICTIAVTPKFQLQIQSFDPTFKES